MRRDGKGVKGVGFGCKHDVFDGLLTLSSLFYVHTFPSVPLLANFGFSFTDKGRKKFVVPQASHPHLCTPFHFPPKTAY